MRKLGYSPIFLQNLELSQRSKNIWLKDILTFFSRGNINIVILGKGRKSEITSDISNIITIYGDNYQRVFDIVNGIFIRKC